MLLKINDVADSWFGTLCSAGVARQGTFYIRISDCIQSVYCNVGRIMDDRDQAWSRHVWRVKEKRSVGVPDKKQIAEWWRRRKAKFLKNKEKLMQLHYVIMAKPQSGGGVYPWVNSHHSPSPFKNTQQVMSYNFLPVTSNLLQHVSFERN